VELFNGHLPRHPSRSPVHLRERGEFIATIATLDFVQRAFLICAPADPKFLAGYGVRDDFLQKTEAKRASSFGLSDSRKIMIDPTIWQPRALFCSVQRRIGVAS
jgi:hypothetical protein